MRRLISPLAAVVFAFCLHLQAQTSLFTYQGSLKSNGTTANGLHDFRVKLCDAATNGNVLSTVTNSATMVSNGVFTLNLDFGSSQFVGAVRWLEIDVRLSNPTNVFVTVSPRQQLTSTPYALRATTAGAAFIADTVASGGVSVSSLASNVLNATNLTGIVPDTLLSANVPKLVGGVLSDSVLSSNIARVPLTVLVTNLSVQAQANTRYVLLNTNQVTVQLPTNCSVGDRISVVASGAGGWKIVQSAGQFIHGAALDLNIWTARESNRAWKQIACSSDGMKVVACAANTPLMISTDGGTTWTPRETERDWQAVACSSDGNKIYASADLAPMQVSDDGGTNWTPRAYNPQWYRIACSANGSRAVAVDNSGFLYSTTDGGTNWTKQAAAPTGLCSVRMSANGAKVLGAKASGQIYTSSDYGTNWFARETSRAWTSVSGTADLVQAAASSFNGAIFVTWDSGVNWVPSSSGLKQWNVVECASAGSILVGAGASTPLYVSKDFGGSWKGTGPTLNWAGAACSANGDKIYAAALNGQIYTLDTTQTDTTMGTSGYLAGGRSAAIELQYLGGGVFTPVNHEGTLTGN